MNIDTHVHYEGINKFSYIISFSGYRLNYAIVGLMNEMPTLASVQRGSYPMCALLPKIVPDGARVTQRCNARAPASRFVIIQQPPTGGGWLTICELEVYEMTKNRGDYFDIEVSKTLLCIGDRESSSCLNLGNVSAEFYTFCTKKSES